MAYVDICAHPRMITFVYEPKHRVHAIQQAEPERLELQRDVYVLLIGVITETATAFETPLPLRFGGNDFPLPNVFAKHQQDVLRPPCPRQIYEFLRAFDCEVAHGLLEIDDTRSREWHRNDGQADFLGCLSNGA